MKPRMLLGGIALLLVICGAACGGGGDVCEQAFDKTKACATNLDCTKLTGMEQAACNLMKQLYGGMDYAASKSACEKAKPGQCECTGENKTAAEKVVNGQMDPATCSFEDSSRDGGA